MFYAKWNEIEVFTGSKYQEPFIAEVIYCENIKGNLRQNIRFDKLFINVFFTHFLLDFNCMYDRGLSMSDFWY